MRLVKGTALNRAYGILRASGCHVLMLLIMISGNAQKKYTLSGYVRDSANGEFLTGASISVFGTAAGVNANTYGFYALTLPAGHYTIIYSYLGYATIRTDIVLDSSIRLNENLRFASIEAQTITITDKRGTENVISAAMSSITLSAAQIKKLPALFGEADVLKAIQLLPGVQSAGEGNTGLYIRGGGPDQNLILLDDAPVYNTGHLFGFFSIFNADAIRDVTLIKGGMPANYGGRLSSVVDISMKEGNDHAFHGEGGIGLIASRLSLEGPLVPDKASFMLSGRRTYIDLLAKPFESKTGSFYGSGYYFYDLNAKVNYNFSEKDHLYLSGYLGRDVFNYKNTDHQFSANIPWGNTTGTLRWNHLFSDKLFANTALIYNDYEFSFNADQNNFQIGLSSGIRDVNLKTDFDYYQGTKNHLKFGADLIYHTFFPSTASGSAGSIKFNPANSIVRYGNELALYALDEYEFSSKLKINFGLRYSFFEQVGPFIKYNKDSSGNVLDSTIYGRFQPVQRYGGLEPRIILRYAFSDSSSLKASVSKNYQYIHLVSNSATTLPTDLWVPSTYAVKPEIAWEYSMGYFKNFHSNMYETSLEVYYRSMANQIQFGAGYTPSLEDPENSFVFGKGWAYGAELFLHKQQGRLTGWIGYTLAWTWQQFPALNNGKPFPAKYDRRNDLSVVGSYELGKKWTVSAVFIFATGNTATLPDKFYFIEGTLTQSESSIDAYRMPPYDRLDISVIYSVPKKPGRKFSHSWDFSVYNAYSRLNPYFIYFNQTGNYLNSSLTVQAEKVSIFPILPSITWNFSF
jgi:hypothetical protein